MIVDSLLRYLNSGKINFLSDIYRLKHITRYSNIPKITKENVAEHGFFVASIVMALHDLYRFNLGRALAIAVAHDMPEMELNDCPVIIKKKYPSIAKAFQECEKDVAECLPRSVQIALGDWEGDSVEKKIVHLADVMQCSQYAECEIRLGNEGYMKVVYNNSISRMHELVIQLRGFELRRKEK